MENSKKLLLALALVYSSSSLMARYHGDDYYDNETDVEAHGAVVGGAETVVASPFRLLGGRDLAGRDKDRHRRSDESKGEFSRKQKRRDALERKGIKRTRAEEREFKDLNKDLNPK